MRARNRHPIKTAGALLSALALAACGASEPRVALPLVAPDGAHPLLKDFIDICSQAIDEPVSASALAKARGWTFEGATGGVSAFQNPAIDGMLQMMEVDYPHIEIRSCTLNITGEIPEDLGLGRIGEIEDVQGELLTLRDPLSAGSDEIGSGRWSFISKANQVVTITTTEIPDRFITLNMSTAQRVTPDKN